MMRATPRECAHHLLKYATNRTAIYLGRRNVRPTRQRVYGRARSGNPIDMLTRRHNDEGLLLTIILALLTILGGLYVLAALIG